VRVAWNTAVFGDAAGGSVTKVDRGGLRRQAEGSLKSEKGRAQKRNAKTKTVAGYTRIRIQTKGGKNKGAEKIPILAT